jgi:hypothetical protein
MEPEFWEALVEMLQAMPHHNCEVSTKCGWYECNNEVWLSQTMDDGTEREFRIDNL